MLASPTKAVWELSARSSRQRSVRFLASPSQIGPTQNHPLQTSEQRLTRLGERLHSSDGKAAWNDHHEALSGRQPGRGQPSPPDHEELNQAPLLLRPASIVHMIRIRVWRSVWCMNIAKVRQLSRWIKRHHPAGRLYDKHGITRCNRQTPAASRIGLHHFAAVGRHDTRYAYAVRAGVEYGVMGGCDADSRCASARPDGKPASARLAAPAITSRRPSNSVCVCSSAITVSTEFPGMIPKVAMRRADEAHEC